MLGGLKSCSPIHAKAVEAATSDSAAEGADVSIQFNDRDERGVGKSVSVVALESKVFRCERFLDESLRETCRLIRLCARWERFES